MNIMLNLFRWIGLGVLALTLVLTGIWCALALWYRFPSGEVLRATAAAFFIILALGAAAFLLVRHSWMAVLLYVCALLIFGVWWRGIRPSNNLAWTPDVARPATGSIAGNELTVDDVRDFTWRSDSDFDPKWELRRYDLSKLTDLDIVMSYWAGEAIAHTIISFGFADGTRLDFSIETRKQIGQPYSAIAGFFKEYELVMIAADERDIVRVRSNVRGEDVRIYRLRVPPAEALQLLRAYVAQANALAAKPRFYNTLTANCTTLVFDLVRTVHPGLPMDPRIILSGYLPNYLYDIGATNTSMNFDTLKQRSKIDAAARLANEAPDFSVEIRKSLPQT